MESHEPAVVHVDPGRFAPPLTRTRTGKRRCKGNGEGTASTFQNSQEALPLSAPADTTATGRKRKALDSSLPIRRSPRLSSEQSAPGSGTGAQPELDTQSDQVTGQPPPPSPLAASQRPYRIQLSRAKRNLHGAGPRAIGSLYFLQTFTAFLQFIGAHYPATGRDQITFFETNDRMSTKDWKAVQAALDRNQLTTKFSNCNPNFGENPLTDRSSGIGPIHCIEP